MQICITLVLSLVAFNLVAATAKIPEMPYLNVFDWFIFTAYINAISVLLVSFIESVYIGHFMGVSLSDIIKTPRNKKLALAIKVIKLSEKQTILSYNLIKCPLVSNIETTSERGRLPSEIKYRYIAITKHIPRSENRRITRGGNLITSRIPAPKKETTKIHRIART